MSMHTVPRRAVARAFIIATLALPVMSGVPSHAAASGSVAWGSAGGGCAYSPTCLAFSRTCRSELAVKDNAITTSVAPVAAVDRGETRSITGAITTGHPSATQSGSLQVQFFNAACGAIGTTIISSPLLKKLTLNVPSTARWIALTPGGMLVIVDYRWTLS
jgi:hypothetical protein